MTTGLCDNNDIIIIKLIKNTYMIQITKEFIYVSMIFYGRIQLSMHIYRNEKYSQFTVFLIS